MLLGKRLLLRSSPVQAVEQQEQHTHAHLAISDAFDETVTDYGMRVLACVRGQASLSQGYADHITSMALCLIMHRKRSDVTKTADNTQHAGGSPTMVSVTVLLVVFVLVAVGELASAMADCRPHQPAVHPSDPLSNQCACV